MARCHFLAQGLSNAVGMALTGAPTRARALLFPRGGAVTSNAFCAETHLAAVFNKPDMPIVDHFTFVICGGEQPQPTYGH